MIHFQCGESQWQYHRIQIRQPSLPIESIFFGLNEPVNYDLIIDSYEIFLTLKGDDEAKVT